MIELQYALPEDIRQKVLQGLQKQYRCAGCGKVYHILPEQTCFQCSECGCRHTVYDY